MGLISNMIREKRSEPSIISLRNPPSWYVDLVGGGITSAGATVTETIALGLTAVYACVNIISDTMATMPLHVYKRLIPRGKERDIQSELYALLHDAPNPEMTSFSWRKLMNVHRLLWGAGISEIEFKNGNPIALWPIAPWLVTPKRTTKGSLYYEYNDPIKNTTRLFQPWEVVVFTTMQTTDKWLSPIALHRETIGSSIAVNEYGAKTFGSGINPAGILSGVSFTEEDSEASIRKKFGDCYTGLNSNRRLMILEEGVKFERIGLPPEDAQYLETRRFNISEIARIYGVPLYMLADHEKQTSWGSGIEEQKDGYITFTILPIATLEEQELNKKLIKDSTKFCEFMTTGLLRGTMSNRMDAYQKGFSIGLYSPDDMREMENLNPLPDGQGDVYLYPLNYQSLKFSQEMPVNNTNNRSNDYAIS